MSEVERSRAFRERIVRRYPWHAPPHFEYAGEQRFIVTAACFEHQHIVGKSPDRMLECESSLIEICDEIEAHLYAWCILPNHYHLLIRTDDIKAVLKRIGKFHGSSSYRWNGEDDARGRQVWFRAVERSMRSERHYFATLNYIHHNPVKHGYTLKWQDWPFTSAAEYVERVVEKRLWEFGVSIQYWIMEKIGIPE